ncbi:AraC family transcriptional regulator [Hyphomicrobium sp.]|uniref:AraC family transcriptional regulator n=1 Tax=Hyphomicrobium sp. TaxID=82 RepID=UPI002B75578F|nr:AraC family transcriptional regulator [Hyphomicrobium sp.]HVZ05900.1 AraC family transcriptional regulator [Hyphomicrobium sp.]
MIKPLIHAISQGRRIPVFRNPFLSSANSLWAGFPLEESDSKLEEISTAYFPHAMVFVVTHGSGTAHWKDRGTQVHHSVVPGALSISRSHCELRSSWATNAWSRVAVQLDSSKLRSIAPSFVEGALPPMLPTRDSMLESLVLAMRDEVKVGCPSGRLFAEAISIALVEYLAGRYATSDDPQSSSLLSPAQKRGISHYVRENLADDISVSELAAIVGMSPAHFSRQFRATFGVTPYRFVLQERITRAKDLLETTTLSSSQISLALGFSSQSHFAKLFRQFSGVTPKQYRAAL